jgi:hypothetical protein
MSAPSLTWRDNDSAWFSASEDHTASSHCDSLAPEISLSRFQDRNGQGYLDLLRSLTPEQIPPNQYVRLDHPIVDALFASGIQAPLETVEAVPADREALDQQE